MNHQWSLDALYTSYQDKKYQKDLSIYQNLYQDLNFYVHEMNESIESIERGLSLLEKEYDYGYRLKMYSTLIQAMDSQNHEALLQLQNISQLQAQRASSIAMIEKHLGTINIPKTKLTLEYQYYLQSLHHKEQYSLSPNEENILSQLYPTSLKAFNDMYYHLTSNAHHECLGEDMTLTQIKNLCHDTSKKVRKEAFLKEMECYKDIAEPLAFSINNIKKQQLTIAKMRGYRDPLDKMLKESGMSQKTLDAMISSVEKYLPIFQEYLYTKAQKLGHSNGMPWYDIYATIGECHYEFSIEQCEEKILDAFRQVDDSLYSLAHRAFNEKWIDYPSRFGKQGGAFCENLAFIKESRLMTNYNKTLSDVVTVAHELGHAYHGYMIENHRPLNREYSMPLAETASMFNENIMYHSFFKEADAYNQMIILDIQLSALCQVVCDIYARYTFEKSVFENVEKGFLFADDLNQLMIKALKKAFGKGMDEEWLHPYRWITKIHYYIPDIAYYNFPYTFGALFSRGLYALYEKDHHFFKDYQKLLNASTTHSVEDTAKVAGIDLTKEDFWIESLESIHQQMKDFLNLVNNYENI